MCAASDAAAGRELMSAADVGRTVSRIAHQIIEKTALDGADAPRVVLLGIPTRGVTLADRLAANIAEFSGAQVAHGHPVRLHPSGQGGQAGRAGLAGHGVVPGPARDPPRLRPGWCR